MTPRCVLGGTSRSSGRSPAQLTSIEISAEAAVIARQTIESADLTKYILLRVESVSDFEPICTYDFAFFDTSVPNEFDRLHPHLESGSTLVFQNVSEASPGAGIIRALSETGRLHGISFNTPRGLFVGKLLR
jgi:predicted O-methyltransferase YrrM